MSSTTPASRSRQDARLLPGPARPPADHPPKDRRRTALHGLIRRAALAAGAAVVLLGPLVGVAGQATGAAASNKADTAPGTTAAGLPTGSHSWKIVGSANPTGATTSVLDGVACSSSTNCEAVGYSESGSGSSVTLAERWNGTQWALQTTPNPAGAIASTLHAVACSSSTHCEAVGSYNNSSDVLVTLAEVWNGTKWAVQATPNPAGATNVTLNAVACLPSTRACEAVGSYINSSGVTVTLAERWNGTKWALRTTPDPAGATDSELYAAACPSATDCEAVGWSANSSHVVTLAERWNGTQWALQATPNPAGSTDSELYAAACSSATGCEAAGVNFTTGGALAERWNGTKWALQTTPPTGPTNGPSGVACPTSTPDCEAVGSADNSSNVAVTLAEQWNGTKWALQATPNPAGAASSVLLAVACPSATNCEAVGEYFNSSGVMVTLAEKWS
jgi:hypothetical protein